MTFTETLKAHRAAANLTQRAVARSLGVTETCVYYWEAGSRKPDLGHLAQLEQLLGATPGALLVPLAYGDTA